MRAQYSRTATKQNGIQSISVYHPPQSRVTAVAAMRCEAQVGGDDTSRTSRLPVLFFAATQIQRHAALRRCLTHLSTLRTIVDIRYANRNSRHR